MDENERLQQQIADIGTRYLKRTLGEMDRLRELAQLLRDGAAERIKELEQMAHKIHGSASMFGFDAVGERARALELLAGDPKPGDPQFMSSIEACIVALDERVRAAAQERGLS